MNAIKIKKRLVRFLFLIKQKVYNIINMDTKEEFCGACLAIPFAIAGTGASIYGSKSKGTQRTKKRILLWGGLVTTMISVLIIIYFVRTCSDCA